VVAMEMAIELIGIVKEFVAEFAFGMFDLSISVTGSEMPSQIAIGIEFLFSEKNFAIFETEITEIC
jgi:hypothetical protein